MCIRDRNLKAQLRMNQIEEAKNYLNALEQDLEDVYELVDSGNLNVDAILNSKPVSYTHLDVYKRQVS